MSSSCRQWASSALRQCQRQQQHQSTGLLSQLQRQIAAAATTPVPSLQRVQKLLFSTSSPSLISLPGRGHRQSLLSGGRSSDGSAGASSAINEGLSSLLSSDKRAPAKGGAEADMISMLVDGAMRSSKRLESGSPASSAASDGAGGGINATNWIGAVAGSKTERHSMRDSKAYADSEAFLRLMPRRWRAGDVYAPKDLGSASQKKYANVQRPREDIFDILNINPLDNYKNFSVISEFMTSAGRIRPATETGLRAVNQRRMAKAIRRAIGMGLHPSVHRHPELLKKTVLQARGSRRTAALYQ